MKTFGNIKPGHLIIPLVFFLTACAPLSAGVGGTQEQPTLVDQVQQPKAEMVVSTGTGDVGTFTLYQQGDFKIQILSPQDGEVVKTKQIEVSGNAPVETVITINDQIILVSSSGDFSAPVSLEEGPNVIELVASDEKGNELDIILTVMYEP